MKKERETNTNTNTNTETQTETQNGDTQTTTQTQTQTHTQTPPKIKQPNVQTEGETGAERGAWLHTDKTVIEISSDTTTDTHAHTNAHAHKKSNKKKQPAAARKCVCVYLYGCCFWCCCFCLFEPRKRDRVVLTQHESLFDVVCGFGRPGSCVCCRLDTALVVCAVIGLRCLLCFCVENLVMSGCSRNSMFGCERSVIGSKLLLLSAGYELSSFRKVLFDRAHLLLHAACCVVILHAGSCARDVTACVHDCRLGQKERTFV